ncbi:hypothetical protein FWK35_00019350 [Aphis craccivora]|uniref:Uncharacterized protein n=1 Tax=Aphis craccivora TaxID=307492 RepID=A0A6G0W2F4_APHCR|nr:hypothetical protein FWK35_00019350 [Aphis craccivora]
MYKFIKISLPRNNIRLMQSVKITMIYNWLINLNNLLRGTSTRLCTMVHLVETTYQVSYTMYAVDTSFVVFISYCLLPGMWLQTVYNGTLGNWYQTSIIRILGTRNLVTTTYMVITAFQVETTYLVTNNN